MQVNGFTFDPQTGRYYKTFIADDPNQTIELTSDCAGETVYKNIQIEVGDRATDFVTPEIINSGSSGLYGQIKNMQNQIDSIADNPLTQQQLNALNEKMQILESERQSEILMNTFSELEKQYLQFVDTNNKNIQKSEQDLITISRRIDLITTQFGGLAELKTFIDTFMKSSNEGLVIGKNDASSTIKVSSDRISMFSAGKEVMYISQGVIHIDNGIFTASVQIGKFRTEQYHLNPDMNVIRYVG